MNPLGKDELQLISKKLTFSPDYTRFRSVCKSWRSAAPKHPQLPWFIARDPNDTDNLFKFYEFSFETNKFLQIRELSWLSSSFFVDNKMDCIGYSRGWMALFNRWTSSISLFNPLTNSSIDLPVLKNLSETASDCMIYSSKIIFYLTSDPGESLSDCFALVNVCFSQRVMYCKVGCTDWIEMPHPEFYKYSPSIHICCYRGKTFIASLGDVFVCDFGLFGCNPSVQKIVSFSQDDSILNLIENSWLVELDGDLLLVLYCVTDEDYVCYFNILKLEFGCHPPKVVELKSLGDKALFLSRRSIISLTTSKYPGCKANSIYYKCFIGALSIYDFEKGSNMVLNNDDDPRYFGWKHCGLFSPSLLK